jgi:PAS domain S-box-containing protein
MCLAISVIPIAIIGGLQGFESDESAILIMLIFSVTFCISFLISYIITQPIVKITKSINEISRGNLDVPLEHGEIEEINNLTDSLNRVMASLKLAIYKVGVKKGELFEDSENINKKYMDKQKTVNNFKNWDVTKNVAAGLSINSDTVFEDKNNLQEPKEIKIDIAKEKSERWSENDFDSVIFLDENANITDCNEKMYERLGYSKSEILSFNLADIDALETKKDITNKIKKAKKVGSITFKTIHKKKDGSPIFVEENLQYIADKNTYKGIIREDYCSKKSLK